MKRFEKILEKFSREWIKVVLLITLIQGPILNSLFLTVGHNFQDNYFMEYLLIASYDYAAVSSMYRPAY